MKSNKSINIYMGIIGEAYVDKETAYGVLLAAKKNILDVQAIIDFANNLSRPLNKAIENANVAIDNAVDVYNLLKESILNAPKDSIKYNKLYALLDDLNENDFDDNFSNGGNIYTARENLALLESLEQHRQDIIGKANELLEANRLNAVVRCKEYNIAKEIFESLVPPQIISPEDLSDSLESEYMRALNSIRNDINSANTISETLNEISSDVTNKINNINDGIDENQYVTTNDTLYWYAGNVRPDNVNIMYALGFDWNEDGTSLKNTYKDEDGIEHDVDFGIDGPLKANKWFHLPYHFPHETDLIAGVDGGRSQESYWYVVVPKYILTEQGLTEYNRQIAANETDLSKSAWANQNAENESYVDSLRPAKPSENTVHPDGSHDHIAIANNDYVEDGEIVINNITYTIWKTESNALNSQRLNVYMHLGAVQEDVPEESQKLYYYIGSVKPSSNSVPFEGNEADNNLKAGWGVINEIPQALDITVYNTEGNDLSKIFYVAIPNNVIILDNDMHDITSDEITSPFTMVYNNLEILGHIYDVYITGNEEARFNYVLGSLQDIVITIPETIVVNGITYYKEQPAQPGDNYQLVTQEENGITYYAWIYVEPQTIPVERVKFTSAPVYMLVGDTYELSAEVLPPDATNKNISWSISDNSVISLEGSIITALALGQSNITVTSEDGNKSITISVKVIEYGEYDANKKYWYIGLENQNSIDNIVLDNNVPGWHEIGTTTEGFVLDTNDISNEVILDNAQVYNNYYVIIPDELGIYDFFGFNLLNDGSFNEVSCNIQGYKAYQYVYGQARTVSGLIIKESNETQQNPNQGSEEPEIETYTAEEAAAYNLTIEGAWQYGEVKTPAIEGQEAVLYTDDEVNEHNAALNGAVHEGDPKSTKYYWYIGTENSSSVSNIQTDNTVGGWHEIGSSLSNFVLDTNNNLVHLSDSRVPYYVIIPNNLHIYDGLGTNIEELTFDSVTCNIPGYKAFAWSAEKEGSGATGVRDVTGIIIKQ